MKKNLEPWSKRIWYGEILILIFLFWITNSNIIVMITLMAVSVIAIGITSIYLKKIESPDIKPALNSSNSFSQQLINNTDEVLHDEKQYNSLRGILNVPVLKSASNMQQISPIATNYSSIEQIEDEPHAKYVTLEGVRYRVRSKTLKLRNKLINNITDIQGLEKIWRLRKLDLSHNQITTMKGIENLPNLRKLKLSDNKIQKIENIKNFQRLKKLTLDNNQLKELNSTDLPNRLTHINIAKNPIEKFTIYTKVMYNKIHFGPKKWFPKQEIKSLKRQMRHITHIHMKKELGKIFGIFMLWVGITFGIALLINLIIWGVFQNYGGITLNFWAFLFAKEWSAALFLGAGILSSIGMVVLYYELK